MPKRCTKEIINSMPKTESWDTLHAEYEAACMMSCKPDETFKKVKTGTVLDEEKSVRWNREEVERLQRAYLEEVKRLNRQKNAKIVDITDRTVKKIAKELGVTEEKAEILWNFVYDRYHASGEMYMMIDEYIGLLKDVMR